VLDEAALSILTKINDHPKDDPITLYELLDISPINKAIATYNKILELDSYNFLRLSVDYGDNRIQYVTLTDRSVEIIEKQSASHP
jgi:hypothetical protein